MRGIELHDGPRPALQVAHPALQPGAQGQRASDAQLLHRHENHDRHHPLNSTALGNRVTRAQISP